MHRASYRQAMRDAHTMARLPHAHRASCTSSLWRWRGVLVRTGGAMTLASSSHARATSSSCPSSSSLASWPRETASTPLTVPTLTQQGTRLPLRSHWFPPHRASAGPPRRVGQPSGAVASGSTPQPSTTPHTIDFSSTTTGDADLSRWRETAFAQAQRIIQLVQQQKQARQFRRRLLVFATQYHRLTRNALALGLDSTERRAYRDRHPSLRAAADALRDCHRGHSRDDSVDVASAALSAPSPADAAALLREEAMCLQDAFGLSPARGGTTSCRDRFEALTALFDAVLFLHAPASSPDVADASEARRCFDWLVRLESTVFPQELYLTLWARLVSTSTANRQPLMASHTTAQAAPDSPTATTTNSTVPDAATVHWEMLSLRRLTQRVPTSYTASAPSAAADVSETATAAARLEADLARDWCALQRHDCLFTSAGEHATQPPEAPGERHRLLLDPPRMFAETGFHARRLEQQLNMSEVARTRLSGDPVSELCARFSRWTLASLGALRSVSPDQAQCLASPEWWDTVTGAVRAWNESLQPRASANLPSPLSPSEALRLCSSTWYDARDLPAVAHAREETVPSPTRTAAASVATPQQGNARSSSPCVIPGTSYDALIHVLEAVLSAAAHTAHSATSTAWERRLAHTATLIATRAPHALPDTVIDGIYALAWRTTADVHEPGDGPLLTALLHTLLRRRCGDTAAACRLVWCIGGVWRTTPHHADAWLPAVLEYLAGSSLPQSEKVVMSLSIARMVTASGVVLPAAAHVALQRTLLLPSTARPGASAERTAAVTSATRHRPHWLRHQARWASAEDWFTDWCANAPLTAAEISASDTHPDALLLLQSSIRCSLAMGCVEDAAILAARLPSVQALQQHPDLARHATAMAAAHVACLHALLFFCSLDETCQSGLASKHLAIELLRLSPAPFKRRFRDQWRQWHRRATGLGGDNRDGSDDTLRNSPTRANASSQAVLSPASHAGTVSVASAVNALLRDPFGRGRAEQLAWPVGSEVGSAAHAFVDLSRCDEPTRARLEQEADVAFTLHRNDVTRHSHWYMLCTTPVHTHDGARTTPRRPTQMRADDGQTARSATDAADSLTAVKTHFLAATAAVRHHPMRS